MPTPLEKFQRLLRELFQFEDAAELDFGIYRIMKLRRERMEQWLTVDLPTRAKEIIEGSSSTFDDDLAQRLEGLRAQIQAVQHDAIDADGNLVALQTSDAGKEYASLFAQQQRAPVRSTADIEILVYNNLYDFFSRYYDAGDFIAKRRWSFAPDGRDTYAVPWNGEEVVLHWANKDQYYIKTGERFTHYRWESHVGEHTFKIEFQLTDADLPATNNKDAKKKFYLPVLDKVAWDGSASTLIVPFHWRGLVLQDKIEAKQEEKIRQNVNEATRERLLANATVAAVPQLVTALMAPKKDAAGNLVLFRDEPVALLSYHLNRWTRKNESDFFIHKDLRRFLTGEMDYFLKSVVLNLDNLLAAGALRGEPNFRLLEAVQKLGNEVIDFLAQLENFQKALFEKKKFIVETSWCLTLDHIPTALKDEVFAAILINDRQWQEWEKLYKLSAMPADLIAPQVRSREFLEGFPYMMLDTALGYDRALIEKLIGSIENLNEQTDGLIIHSENFQALNLLQETYREVVTGIYIDPPYNTDASAILYKNNYKDASWLALLENRLQLGNALLTTKGIICVAIDDQEVSALRFLLRNYFGKEIGIAVVRSNPQSRKTRGKFSPAHEYALFYGKSVDSVPGSLELTERRLARYPKEDEKGRYAWMTFIRTGSNDKREDRPGLYYPIFVDDNDNFRVPDMEWSDDSETYLIREDPRQNETAVYPIVDDNGTRIEKNWQRGPERVASEPEEFRIRRDGKKINIDFKTRMDKDAAPSTWWDEGQYASANYGAAELKQLFGYKPFDFPKARGLVEDCITASGAASETGIVLDFFAGSGTSGHACINFRRKNNGVRKYILTEMGTYYDSVLKQRLLKAVFSESWREGKPRYQQNPKDQNNPYDGVSHCLKLLRLEAYEDSLDNIEFDSTAAPATELPIEFRRDYELLYALDWESRECPTRLAVEKLETPFDYTLTLRRESGTETVKPDVPETFAYLIGLHTRRRFWTKRDNHDYLIYSGTLHADGTETAVVWRTCRDWNEDEFQKEKDWWHEQREALAPGVTRLYVNAACAIEGHLCLDLEFKKRMHPSYATV